VVLVSWKWHYRNFSSSGRSDGSSK